MAITLGKKAGAPTKGETKATVTTEIKESGKVISESKVEEPVDAIKTAATKDPQAGSKPWCTVGFEASYTHNLGNYQSAKVGIFLAVPCQHAEIDAVADLTQNWVNNRMEKAINELTGE